MPKQGIPPIEITKPRQFNNGNIEIIHPEMTRPLETLDKVAADEVLINGRRYRVPERVVVLDFWNRLNKVGVQLDKYAQFKPPYPKTQKKGSFRDLNLGSEMSSPLTSLSSLDDPDDRQLTGLSPPLYDPEDVKVAQVHILPVHLITNSYIYFLSGSYYAAFKILENPLQLLLRLQQR